MYHTFNNYFYNDILSFQNVNYIKNNSWNERICIVHKLYTWKFCVLQIFKQNSIIYFSKFNVVNLYVYFLYSFRYKQLVKWAGLNVVPNTADFSTGPKPLFFLHLNTQFMTSDHMISGNQSAEEALVYIPSV